MKNKLIILPCLCIVITISGVIISGQPKPSNTKVVISTFNSISKEEVEMLLADAAKNNPDAIKRLEEDPALKKQQVENLRQLLAFASQARKEGIADDPINRNELESIRSEVVASNYDREINKAKASAPPFAFITAERITRFWDSGAPDREANFQKFLDSKIELLKAGDPQIKDREITEEERTQGRDFYAKIKIYEKEFDDKAAAGQLPKQFIDKVALQVKLQQAQFLARTYSQKLSERVTVTDEEVANYLARNPEFNVAEKKRKAEDILRRAKSGEDFAKLANEFSEDPGNKNSKGELLGGLYMNVPKGRMVRQFEGAALALEPGKIAPSVVESDFGYHIIKLENKRSAAGAQAAETYDVRHILIATTYKDPADPQGREVPLKQYVRSKLEAEKEKQIVDEIVASNNITVPEDFSLPVVETGQKKVPKKLPLRKKRSVKKRS